MVNSEVAGEQNEDYRSGFTELFNNPHCPLCYLKFGNYNYHTLEEIVDFGYGAR